MKLKRYLDNFLDTFPKEVHLGMDPVHFVHRYSDPADQEIVGFVAAALAYGNVKTVLRSVDGVVSRMGPSPARFISGFDPVRNGHLFEGFCHRWNNGQDVAVLLWILGRLVEEHGSIENAFAAGLTIDDPNTASAMEGFSKMALGLGHERFYSDEDLRTRRGVRYFFPKVSDGSACKRLNLYLRWMVRASDGVDTGAWNRIAPSQLVMPLDTHVVRISRYIGLTERASPGWGMALDVTRSLKRLDASDPLRYDFALCHLGIAGDCPRKQDPVKCVRCPIQPICLL